MINLLPAEQKHQIKAARTNVLLLRYTILSLGALLVLAAMAGGAYLIMAGTKQSNEQVITENTEKASAYRQVDARAKEFRANLSTAKSILDKEVNYTNAVIAIAQVLPPGTVLDSLDLDAKTFGTPTTLSAKTKTKEAALALKDSLQKSTIFSNVSFQSLTDTGQGTYPWDAKLSVTISKGVAK